MARGRKAKVEPTYRINSDKHQFIIEESYWSSKEQQIKWLPYKYTSTFEEVCRLLLDQNLKTNLDVEDLLQSIQEATERTLKGIEAYLTSNATWGSGKVPIQIVQRDP